MSATKKCPACGAVNNTEKALLEGRKTIYCTNCGTPIDLNTGDGGISFTFEEEESFSRKNKATLDDINKVVEGVKSECTKQPIRKGYNVCMWICAVLAAITLIVCLCGVNWFGSLLQFLVLGFMFAVLARSPKEDTKVLGLISKRLFVIIAIVIFFVIEIID